MSFTVAGIVMIGCLCFAAYELGVNDGLRAALKALDRVSPSGQSAGARAEDAPVHSQPPRPSRRAS